MKHPVMGAAKAQGGQDFVRFADEIAIGEKQQFGEFEQPVARLAAGGRGCVFARGTRRRRAAAGLS